MTYQWTTHQVNPHYHSNSQTEFRIDSKVWSPHFRLANIYPTLTTGTGEEYQYLNGVGSLIKNITLFHDNTPLDSVIEARNFLAFQEMTDNNMSGNTNMVNSNVNHKLSNTRMGFSMVNHHNTTFVPEENPRIAFVNSAVVIHGQIQKEKSGVLDLRRCLRFLTSGRMINAKPLRLRLVIEWETDPAKIFVGAVPVSFSMDEPVLFLDEVVGGNFKNNYNYNYISMEWDRVRVPAVVAGVVSSADYRYNGFTGKMLRNVLLVNNLNTKAARVIQGSVAQLDEKFNVRLNGVNLFGGYGVDTPNKKLDYLGKVWRPVNHPQGTQWYELYNHIASLLNLSDVDYLTGRLSYGACRINDRVETLELHYERKGSADVGNDNGKDAFNLDCWAEVVRSINVRDGNVIVGYA